MSVFNLVTTGENPLKAIRSKFPIFEESGFIVINKNDTNQFELIEEIKSCPFNTIETIFLDHKIPCNSRLIEMPHKYDGKNKLKIFTLETTTYFIIFKNQFDPEHPRGKWERIAIRNSFGELESFDFTPFL